MFDVPFLYGAVWQRSDDEAPSPVAVISRRLNEKLFKGENSLGRDILLSGQHFQIVGVHQRVDAVASLLRRGHNLCPVK